MAIDDNTVYGLYGSQVKELPEKIEAVKGLAKALTTEDYNYPTTGTKTGVALWLLEPGIYALNDSSVNIYTESGQATSASNGYVVVGGESNGYVPILLRTNNLRTGSVQKSTGSGGYYPVLDQSSIINNLTNTSTTNPLSAKQGKVLKDLIDSLVIQNAGAPTTSTVGQVGTLYEDTTNGDLYICTDATNPYVWEEVSGGGGGGDTVYSTKTTSNSATGGAVYIGNLGTDQTEVQDPSPNDNHYKYFWALPWSNNGASYGQPGNGSVNILGSAKGNYTVAIGSAAGSGAYGAAYAVMIGNNANAGPSGVSIGDGANTTQDSTGNVCIGASTATYTTGVKNSISLGRFARAARSGELNIGTGINTTEGFNNSNYRVIGGVHDPQSAHDAATKGYVDTAVAGVGTGTRRATSSGWSTSAPLDYVLQSSGSPAHAQGAMFYAGKNLTDLPEYVGIGVKSDQADPEGYTPFLLTQQVSDDGTGTLSGQTAARRIATYDEIPATFTNNEWNALWA